MSLLRAEPVPEGVFRRACVAAAVFVLLTKTLPVVQSLGQAAWGDGWGSPFGLRQWTWLALSAGATACAVALWLPRRRTSAVVGVLLVLLALDTLRGLGWSIHSMLTADRPGGFRIEHVTRLPLYWGPRLMLLYVLYRFLRAPTVPVGPRAGPRAPEAPGAPAPVSFLAGLPSSPAPPTPPDGTSVVAYAPRPVVDVSDRLLRLGLLLALVYSGASALSAVGALGSSLWALRVRSWLVAPELLVPPLRMFLPQAAGWTMVAWLALCAYRQAGRGRRWRGWLVACLVAWVCAGLWDVMHMVRVLYTLPVELEKALPPDSPLRNRGVPWAAVQSMLLALPPVPLLVWMLASAATIRPPASSAPAAPATAGSGPAAPPAPRPPRS